MTTTIVAFYLIFNPLFNLSKLTSFNPTSTTSSSSSVYNMPQKKRASGRRSEPKLFKCTGFGNCDMVFTRSEHLARHARKHTGEVNK